MSEKDDRGAGTGRDAGANPSAARAGGVAHDSRGNAVWQWAVDTGRHALDSTSRLLRRLEVPGLRVEDDTRPGASSDTADDRTAATRSAGTLPGAPDRPSGAAARTVVPPRSSGYDPYGGSAGSGNAARPVRANAGRGGAKPAPQNLRKPAAAAAPRRSLWQRLFRRD